MTDSNKEHTQLRVLKGTQTPGDKVVCVSIGPGLILDNDGVGYQADNVRDRFYGFQFNLGNKLVYYFMESFGIKKNSFLSTHPEEDNKHQMLVLKTNSCRKKKQVSNCSYLPVVFLLSCSPISNEKKCMCVCTYTHIHLYTYTCICIVWA